MDSLKALKIFSRVAKLGSFTAAAREAGLSPSMVGNHVRSLEDWFGAPLLLRTTRQQSLTAEGHEVLDHADAIIAGLVALEDAAGRTSDPAGPVRVTAPVGIGRHFAAPVLRRLSLLHPKLQIELLLSDREEDLVKAGLDLALRNGPLTGGGSSLVARAVGRQSLLLAAAPAYADAAGLPASLDDLRTHRAVRYARNGRPRAWLFPTAEGMAQLDPPAGFIADDIETLRDAAVDGLGIAWLPDWLLARNFGDGSLLPVLPEQPAFTIDTYLIRSAAPPARRVRITADMLAAELGKCLRR